MFHNVEDFDDVSTSLQTIQNEIDEVSSTVRQHHTEINDRVESAETENNQLEQRLDKLDDQLQQLADQIAVLERRALTTSTNRADLNTRTPTERRLARSARRAKELERELLPEYARKYKQNSISTFESQVQELADNESTLVEAIAELADLAKRDPRTAEHQAARARYTQAKTQVETSRRFVTPHRCQAIEDDRATLAADAKKRAKHGAEIDAGKQDWFRLCRALRNRISKAIDSGAALPPWFTTVLGPTPPATRTEKWVNTATLLLAYRAMYEVTDLVVALGPKPSRNGASLRHTLYEELEDKVRTYRRR
ncbi:hypothetical protein AB0I53_19230 [Saccharopolyspora sp. NPDC050389]|uniref:hypothetical protein n=1 Tax=Saccharopolyspora sp. NPDC050389 TaxID=3155516 RepID=UPI00340A3DD4